MEDMNRVSKRNQDNICRITGYIHDETCRSGVRPKLLNSAINVTCNIYDSITNKKIINQVKTKIYKGKKKYKRNTRRVAIFATYSETGNINEYVSYYLKALSKICDYVLVVSDNEMKNEDEFKKIEKYVNVGLFQRHNCYDFGSWRIGYKYLIKKKKLNKFDQLVLVNDSCYGPVFDLNDAFSLMSNKYDFWGLVGSADIRYHILSFFMVFNNNVFCSEKFHSFFEGIPDNITWEYAVNECEKKLTAYLSNDYSHGVYLPELSNQYMKIKCGNGNPTVWPLTSVKHRMPLIKVKAMTGAYGIELNEGVSDTLEEIKNHNIELCEIIKRDLISKGTKYTNGQFFDKKSYNINKLIENKEYISFDVFDTLLSRLVANPTDVFLIMSEIINDSKFAAIRINSEIKARTKPHKNEVTIDEIYSVMPKKYEEYKNLELEIESKVLYRNPLIYEIYKQALTKNKKIICISDMYLPKKFIRNMLKLNGYTNIYDIFVSSEFNATKNSGELFRIVCDKLNTKPNNIIHIGDNEISDKRIPMLLGIDSLVYNKLFEDFIEKPANVKYKIYFANNLTLPASIHVSMCAMHRSYMKNDVTQLEDIGYCLGGPLAISYVNYINKIVNENNFDQILFIARDGYVLEKIFDKYFNTMKIDHNYLYLTRYVGLTSLLDYLDDQQFIQTILRAVKKDIPEIICDESFEFNKAEFEHYSEKIHKWAENNYKNIVNYVNNVCANKNNILLVDLIGGIKSTYRFAKTISGNRIKHCVYAMTTRDDNDINYSTFSNIVFSEKDECMVKLAELLITSNETPIMSIDEKGNPVYANTPELDRTYYNLIEKGIMKYCDDFINHFKESNVYMSYSDWNELAKSFLMYCNLTELKLMSSVYDSPNADNTELIVPFDEIIMKYRKNYNGL